MTPQQIEAMKLALEALDIAQGMLADLRSQHQPKMLSAYTALEEVLAEHAMCEVQRLGQEIEQKIGCVNHDCDQCKAQPEQEPVIGKWSLREVYFDEDGEPIMHRSTPQPERHELQAKGEHPAPCARHCEANAFKIVIKNLKAQLAQPKQEPVAHTLNCVCGAVWDIKADGSEEMVHTPDITPPQRKPLTDEMKKQMRESCDSHEMRGAFVDGWLSAEAAHGIWPENSDCHGPDWTDRDGEYLK